MDINTKDLVIFDLDGTLTPSKSKLEPAMARMLARLLAKKKVAVISGCSWEQFQEQFLGVLSIEIGGFANLFLLPTSGSQLFTYQDNKWAPVYQDFLSPEERQKIIATLRLVVRQLGFEIEDETYGPQIEDRQSQVTFSALGQRAPLDLKKTWDSDQTKRRKIVEALTPLLADYSLRIGGATSIDITKQGRDKAYGITRLLNHLSVDIPRAIFVGDALYPGGNDASALTVGLDCQAVSGPGETLVLIEQWLAS